MYETKHQRPLSREHFQRRLIGHLAAAVLLLVLSLALGVAGYMGFEHLSGLDALLNASMLLGGMGPVNAPVTDWGKLFASFFALYSGLVFLITAALLFSPLLHRLMHRLHWDDS